MKKNRKINWWIISIVILTLFFALLFCRTFIGEMFEKVIPPANIEDMTTVID